MCTPRRYAEIGLVDFHSFSTLSQGDEHQIPVTFDLGQQGPVLHEQGGLWAAWDTDSVRTTKSLP